MVARLHGITDLPVFIPNADTYVHEYRDWQSQYEQQAQVNVVLQHAAAADAGDMTGRLVALQHLDPVHWPCQGSPVLGSALPCALPCARFSSPPPDLQCPRCICRHPSDAGP
jgi:hypothetical protein